MFQIIKHSWANKPEQATTPIFGSGIKPGSVKIAFNDPPYNLGISYADDPTGDRRNIQDYRDWTEGVIREQSELLMPGGTMWWMVPEQHGDFVGRLLTNIIGPRVHRICWYETFAQYQAERLTDDYRFIFCHRKVIPGNENTAITFNPNSIRIPSDRQLKYKDKRANPAGRVPGRVWKFENPAVQQIIDALPIELAEQVVKHFPQTEVPGQVWKVRRLQGTSDDHVEWHNAQLPPELLDRIIRGWSNEGDVVLDGFAGSGNMGLSAMRNKRTFIGVDQSETYVRKITERLTPFAA